MDFDKFNSIPDSMLKDITPESDNKPHQDGNTMSDDEAFKAAEHTRVPPLGGTSNAPNQPIDAPGNTKVNLGSMFEGRYAVDMIDALLPAILVVLFKKMNIVTRKSELQLTENEKKTMAPVVQNCLNTLNLDFNNPWVALAVTAGFIYGSKVIEKAGVGWLDKQATKVTVEKVKQHAKEAKQSDQTGADKLHTPMGEQRPGKATEAQVTDNPYKISEAVIAAKMKQLRRSRVVALGILNRQYDKQTKRA